MDAAVDAKGVRTTMTSMVAWQVTAPGRLVQTELPRPRPERALAEGATVHVLTRAEAARQLALQLGVTSVGGAYDSPPEPLDSAILFAPVGDLVPVALAALDRGGTPSIAGIHLSQIPALDYHQHLFGERQVRSVTANTRQDGVAFLDHAARHQLRIAVTPYRLDAAAEALDDLAADRIHGVGVLEVL
jgi:alcohol dehydrogenase, propanol-preferring